VAEYTCCIFRVRYSPTTLVGHQAKLKEQGNKYFIARRNIQVQKKIDKALQNITKANEFDIMFINRKQIKDIEMAITPS
jgi:hypothetical protein